MGKFEIQINPFTGELDLTKKTALPDATQIGQVLFSIDGTEFTVQVPVTNPGGWLVNNEGILLVAG
jgi:hypothetical protein